MCGLFHIDVMNEGLLLHKQIFSQHVLEVFVFDECVIIIKAKQIEKHVLIPELYIIAFRIISTRIIFIT